MASQAFPEGIPDFLRIYFLEAICEVLAPIISLKKVPKKRNQYMELTKVMFLLHQCYRFIIHTDLFSVILVLQQIT